MKLLFTVLTLFMVSSCQSSVNSNALMNTKDGFMNSTIAGVVSSVISEEKPKEVVIVKSVEKVKSIGLVFDNDFRVNFFKFPESNKYNLITFTKKSLERSNKVGEDFDFDFEPVYKKNLSGILKYLGDDKNTAEYEVAKFFYDSLLLKTRKSTPVFLEDGVLFKPHKTNNRTALYDDDIKSAVVIEGKRINLLSENSGELPYVWLTNFISKGEYPELEKDIQRSGLNFKVIELPR